VADSVMDSMKEQQTQEGSCCSVQFISVISPIIHVLVLKKKKLKEKKKGLMRCFSFVLLLFLLNIGGVSSLLSMGI
jgi:hypothetical protein